MSFLMADRVLWKYSLESSCHETEPESSESFIFDLTRSKAQALLYALAVGENLHENIHAKPKYGRPRLNNDNHNSKLVLHVVTRLLTLTLESTYRSCPIIGQPIIGADFQPPKKMFENFYTIILSD